MATASRTKLMTAEEFMASELIEGRYELVRGEVVEVPPPMPEHGRITVNTAFSLESYGRQTGHGYTIVESAVATERGPDTVRGPDVSYFSHARWPLREVGRGLPPVPPDLAVEIVSPSNRPGEILKKVSEYQQVGVLLIWVIHPKRRHVAVYRAQDHEPIFFRENDILEGFPELPGFRCPVADLFPPA